MALSPKGKRYVGQTKQSLRKRWQGHVYDASGNRGYGGCRALDRAIRKYGADAFVLTVLEDGVPVEDLDAREIHHIAEQGSFTHGYNLTSGGNAATSRSESTRRLHSVTKRAQWRDPEVRKNMERCHSEEAIQKVVGLWKERRELKAQGMTVQEAAKMEERYQKSQRKRFRDLEMRQAMRDPEKRDAWLKENARMTPDDRKRQEMCKQRMERVARMSYLDGQEYLLKLKTSAIRTAKSTGASLEHIERWYPNVLMYREISALRKNDGVWPSSAPAPRASSGQSRGKREQTNGASGSMATSVPKSRPSCAPGQYMGSDGQVHDEGSLCPSEFEEE